jgi:hypothetical protein
MRKRTSETEYHSPLLFDFFFQIVHGKGGLKWFQAKIEGLLVFSGPCLLGQLNPGFCLTYFLSMTHREDWNRKTIYTT